MSLLAICGSLRRGSTNMAVLQAAGRLAPPNSRVMIYEGLGDLPLFNPDLDHETPPEPVRDLRRRIGAASGLLLCSPEYARGISGVLKNGLDWLVGSAECPGKPVAVINASQRSVHADASLRLILRTMDARLIDQASITLPLLGRNLDADGIVADPAFAEPLRDALAAFMAAIEADQPPARSAEFGVPTTRD